MDYKELIEGLKGFTYWLGQSGPESHDIHPSVCDKAVAAIETLLAERDAAISLLRKQAWCNCCIHFKGLKGCGIGIMEECTEENAHYQFCGSQKGCET